MNGRACETFRDRLVEYRAGALPALDAAATRAHLDRCADCAAEAELLRDLDGGRRTAPEGFAERVMAAYRGERAAPVASAPGLATAPLRVTAAAPGPSAATGRLRGAGFGARFRALPLAAALAGILIVGAVIARTGFGPGTPADDPAVMQAEAGLAILPWPGDDGVLAGAPALDALTNDEIEALLEELDS